MPPKPRVDYAALDWSRSNDELAVRAGVSVWSIIRWRVRLGMPPGERKARKDIGAHRPHSVALGRKSQPLATAGAKISPLSGRGTENVHAIDWHLVDPHGAEYRVRNLYEFVRSNQDLFTPADVAWKRGSGTEWCNATAGILNIRHGRAKTWKGWTLKS